MNYKAQYYLTFVLLILFGRPGGLSPLALYSAGRFIKELRQNGSIPGASFSGTKVIRETTDTLRQGLKRKSFCRTSTSLSVRQKIVAGQQANGLMGQHEYGALPGAQK